jgi:hypothetical protein
MQAFFKHWSNSLLRPKMNKTSDESPSTNARTPWQGPGRSKSLTSSRPLGLAGIMATGITIPQDTHQRCRPPTCVSSAHGAWCVGFIAGDNYVAAGSQRVAQGEIDNLDACVRATAGYAALSLEFAISLPPFQDNVPPFQQMCTLYR